MSTERGLSGQQVAEANLQTFLAWVESKSDADFRALVSRGVLSRKEIATECGFGKSALDQNPRIKASLCQLEDDLRKRGVLPPKAQQPLDTPPAPLMRESGRQRAAQDTERLRRLEQENAGLKEEVAELKRVLAKYVVLQDALTETGRLPR